MSRGQRSLSFCRCEDLQVSIVGSYECESVCRIISFATADADYARELPYEETFLLYVVFVCLFFIAVPLLFFCVHPGAQTQLFTKHASCCYLFRCVEFPR